MSAPRPPRRRLTTVREVCQEYIARVLSTKTGQQWVTQRLRITEFIGVHGDLSLDDAAPGSSASVRRAQRPGHLSG